MHMGLLSSNVTAFPFHLRADPPWQYRFQTVLADTPDARKISFRLRYQVFCEETGFEDPRSFPDKLEQDTFDGASTIFVLWDHLTSRWAGTMRLVDANKTALPSETICWRTPLLGLDQARSEAVEFSRLCVPPEFRRIHSATHFGDARNDNNTTKSRSFRVLKQEDDEIVLRLILALVGWGQENEIRYCYYLINAALARVLKRLHVPLVTAGAQVEHRGKRKPYRTDVKQLARDLTENLPQVARILGGSKAYIPYSEFAKPKLARTASAPTQDSLTANETRQRAPRIA